MDSSSLTEISLDAVSVNTFTGMGPLKSFPKPIYLLDRKMQLIDKNTKGQFAIDRHLLGLVGNKIHFNNPKHTKYVKHLIDVMLGKDKCAVERFILPCIDGVYRAYSLARYDSIEADFLLTIHDSDIDDEQKIDSLVRAFSLTPSEAKVLSSMVLGNKPKEIAYEMDVSLCTVRSHLRTLYAKMNVRNYNDALKEAIRLLS